MGPWEHLTYRRIKLKVSEEWLFFDPVDVKGDGNCMFNALMSCCSAKNIFNVCDPGALRKYTFTRVLQGLSDDSLRIELTKIFNAYRDEQDAVSLYLYAQEHIRDGVWSSELDALLLSMVYSINVVIISNVPEDIIIFDSAYQLQQCLGKSFDHADTLWLYLHWQPDPMYPKSLPFLTHYCALIERKDLTIDEKAIAYQPGVRFIANINISKTPQSKGDTETPARKKKKRQRISMEAKGKILSLAEKGYSHKVIALKFGMCRSAITRILKNKIVIEHELTELRNRSIKLTGKRILVTADYPLKAVDRATYSWFVQVRNNATQLNVTGDMFLHKAAIFAQKLNIQDTKVSNGWLHGFFKRYGIRSVKRCGERRSFEITSELQNRMGYIKAHLEDFEIQDILNADETALFYKTVSSRTYKTAAEDSRNTKRSKERVTVMICVRADGRILKPQILHTAKSPRCLKNVNINQMFNVLYDTSQKGWQNAGTFKRYLHYLDNIARKEKTRFALVCDNASSHVSAAKDMDPHGSQDTFFRMKHLDILFLPPNCTSECQPCDMGIIRSFKCKFRKFQLLRLFDVLDTHVLQKPNEIFKIEKTIDMAICLRMIQQAINNMDENVIRRCWVKSELLPASQQAKVNSDVDRPSSNFSLDEDIDNELSSIVNSLDLAKLGEGDISAQELINIDSCEPIDETFIDDDEIVNQVLKEGNDKPIDSVVSKRSRPSLATAQAAIRTLHDYAKAEGKESLLHDIECLNKIMPSPPKQVSIMSFLTPK
jgi:DDE superfamily endonuclease/Tc5 transposase DNA-binding domain